MKTNNVSGYIMTPVITDAIYDHHFSARPRTKVIRHTLQQLTPFIHPPPTYAQTSFQTSLLPNDVPTSVQSYVHIAYLSQISCITNYFNLSLSRLTPCVETVLFTAHASIHTYILAHIFTI